MARLWLALWSALWLALWGVGPGGVGDMGPDLDPEGLQAAEDGDRGPELDPEG